MNPQLLTKLEKIIEKTVITFYKDKSKSIFERVIEFCQEHYEGPASTISEIKLKQNTKIKGDVFEHFAYLFFSHAYRIKFDNVWLLKDVPKEVLTSLGLKKNDLGIDLIAVKNDNYYAIQAKYRKKGYKGHHGVSWKQLSTFYALVLKTGPFVKHIVITNADYVRHIGKKSPSDLSICYRTCNKISVESWLAMAKMKENYIDENKSPVLDVETLREKRLAYFSKL